MSMTTIKNTDKIKLLDQMLEDIAGDEFDEYGTDENGFNTSAKRYSDVETLDMIDTAH
jgi:hypothetical protein